MIDAELHRRPPSYSESQGHACHKPSVSIEPNEREMHLPAYYSLSVVAGPSQERLASRQTRRVVFMLASMLLGLVLALSVVIGLWSSFTNNSSVTKSEPISHPAKEKDAPSKDSGDASASHKSADDAVFFDNTTAAVTQNATPVFSEPKDGGNKIELPQPKESKPSESTGKASPSSIAGSSNLVHSDNNNPENVDFLPANSNSQIQQDEDTIPSSVAMQIEPQTSAPEETSPVVHEIPDCPRTTNVEAPLFPSITIQAEPQTSAPEETSPVVHEIPDCPRTMNVEAPLFPSIMIQVEPQTDSPEEPSPVVHEIPDRPRTMNVEAAVNNVAAMPIPPPLLVDMDFVFKRRHKCSRIYMRKEVWPLVRTINPAGTALYASNSFDLCQQLGNYRIPDFIDSKTLKEIDNTRLVRVFYTDNLRDELTPHFQDLRTIYSNKEPARYALDVRDGLFMIIKVAIHRWTFSIAIDDKPSRMSDQAFLRLRECLEESCLALVGSVFSKYVAKRVELGGEVVVVYQVNRMSFSQTILQTLKDCIALEWNFLLGLAPSNAQESFDQKRCYALHDFSPDELSSKQHVFRPISPFVPILVNVNGGNHAELRKALCDRAATREHVHNWIQTVNTSPCLLDSSAFEPTSNAISRLSFASSDYLYLALPALISNPLLIQHLGKAELVQNLPRLGHAHRLSPAYRKYVDNADDRQALDALLADVCGSLFRFPAFDPDDQAINLPHDPSVTYAISLQNIRTTVMSLGLSSDSQAPPKSHPSIDAINAMASERPFSFLRKELRPVSLELFFRRFEGFRFLVHVQLAFSPLPMQWLLGKPYQTPQQSLFNSALDTINSAPQLRTCSSCGILQRSYRLSTQTKQKACFLKDLATNSVAGMLIVDVDESSPSIISIGGEDTSFAKSDFFPLCNLIGFQAAVSTALGPDFCCVEQLTTVNAVLLQ